MYLPIGIIIGKSVAPPKWVVGEVGGCRKWGVPVGGLWG